MGAPEKIYLYQSDRAGEDYDDDWGTIPLGENCIEYTRTDVFIEKACEKLEKCMYDNFMFQGRLHRKEVIETFIKNKKILCTDITTKQASHGKMLNFGRLLKTIHKKT